MRINPKYKVSPVFAMTSVIFPAFKSKVFSPDLTWPLFLSPERSLGQKPRLTAKVRRIREPLYTGQISDTRRGSTEFKV